MAAIIGASLTGKKVMTATSGPGFSLMQEALGYAVMTEIPCVIVNVMRGGPSTGIPTHGSQGDVNQARWGTHGDHAIIAMTASNHQDVFRMTVEAFNIAETYRTPVVLLFDEVIGHMREKLVVPEKGEKYQEVSQEEGLQPGFYLIANVFGTKRYYDIFMQRLQDRGLEPKSFYRSANKFNYVYLGRYNSIEEARKARDSQFGGRYKGELWIFRVR